MSNQPLQNSTPGQRPGNAVSSADLDQQPDEDALRAFARAAETGRLDDCDPGTVSAAAGAVRALLEPTDDTTSDSPATMPAEHKWAKAAVSYRTEAGCVVGVWLP